MNEEREASEDFILDDSEEGQGFFITEFDEDEPEDVG